MSLKNPAAIIATGEAVEVAGKVQKKASEGISNVDSKTNNAMSWLLVAGTAATLYYIFSFINKVGKVQDAIGEVASNTVSEIINGFSSGAGSENVDLTGLGSVTISPLQAQNKAVNLYEAMKGLGTDFDLIKSQLNGISPADFVLIAQAFGTPRYSLTGEAIWPWPKLNLLQWFSNELDNGEILELAQLHPQIFGT